MCAVIQSYVNVYTHRDFFDVTNSQKVIKCINSFQSMCKNGVNPHAIKQLSKITRHKLIALQNFLELNMF